MTIRACGRAVLRGALILCLAAQAALAADTGEGKPVGPVTGLPIPRFVSMKATEANVRRGPSLTHRIDWVYRRKDLPLQITAEYGHWRRIQDRDGAGGWVHYSLLSGVRTVLFEEEATMRMKPVDTAPANALAQSGVVGRLGACEPRWCYVRTGGYGGWVHKSEIWGVGADELRE
ncbi:SH3 domain-containing protein [Tranquillimonas rosea]|uniref:SH3 domain-containing protein n=1 Tax=Tranquillimonas rosea TaxID=641238 RepID=UPI003BA99D2D